ncbi:hypothetical protein BU16DRAFT_560899 [Lophium mytilinum]|uniref:Uncharacterized protein n=1 Tax=Lophium mytilinum TaxID=390894 RepID=A0A6A6QWJ9_9PEZI|nr:hypothetical protein BU16DRAFT_560899 [Lophium mytilinum]
MPASPAPQGASAGHHSQGVGRLIEQSWGKEGRRSIESQAADGPARAVLAESRCIAAASGKGPGQLLSRSHRMRARSSCLLVLCARPCADRCESGNLPSFPSPLAGGADETLPAVPVLQLDLRAILVAVSILHLHRVVDAVDARAWNAMPKHYHRALSSSPPTVRLRGASSRQ